MTGMLSPESLTKPRIPVETIDEAAVHLKTLPIVAHELPVGVPVADVTMRHYSAGDDWYYRRRASEAKGVTTLNPSANPAEAALFQEAVTAFQNSSHALEEVLSQDGYWWMGTRIENVVNDSLTDVFRLEATDASGEVRTFDILNCTGTEITPQEMEIIRGTTEQVGNASQGKLYDRVQGIVLGDGRVDSRKAAFHVDSEMMVVNMDAIREEPHLQQRYHRYFKEGERPSELGIVLAHEYGHALHGDHAPEEVLATQGSKPERLRNGALGSAASHALFEALPSWTQLTHADGTKAKWRHDETAATELREYPPTPNGHANPREDEADSFGIKAMGGDMSSMPMRSNLLDVNVAALEGLSMGAHSVAIREVELPDGIYHPPRRLQAIRVNAQVG
jgi:hypothetical protein